MTHTWTPRAAMAALRVLAWRPVTEERLVAALDAAGAIDFPGPVLHLDRLTDAQVLTLTQFSPKTPVAERRERLRLTAEAQERVR